MQSVKSGVSPARLFGQFLVILGTAVCLVVSIYLWQVVSVSQAILPVPGLYLVEIIVLSVAAMLGVIYSPQWGVTLVWAVTGVLMAFVVMGAWSIGLSYLPVAALFALAALLFDRRTAQSLAVHLTVCLLSALAQVALMFAAIRLLHPDAMF